MLDNCIGRELLESYYLNHDEYSNIIKEYDNRNINKIIHKNREEALYFLKDLNISSTNNNVESSQRGEKIKQNIVKFRSFVGLENYLRIKSCILTYKK